jgi:aspartyl-tRNA(Asn)/glutamyl-tRNA(Gln) amidotransferase subunit C
MPISEKDVEYVANLARLDLKKKELALLAKQLEDILGFIDKLKRLDVRNVEPSSHVLALKNVFRQDHKRPSLEVKEVLKNAPQKQGSFFVVPKVIE